MRSFNRRCRPQSCTGSKHNTHNILHIKASQLTGFSLNAYAQLIRHATHHCDDLQQQQEPILQTTTMARHVMNMLV